MFSFASAAYYYNELELKGWNGLDERQKAAHRDFKFIKMIWGSYGKPAKMAHSETLIAVLQKEYSNIKACVVCRPLGDFKDYFGLTHKEIYDRMVERFNEEVEDKDGVKMSYIDKLLPHVTELARTYNANPFGNGFHRDNFEVGLALMLYRSSTGIYLESKVTDHLTAWFKNNKYFIYRAAPSELESEDIDGVIYFREDDTPALEISIKCLHALTEKSVNQWRAPVSEGGKGKTRPKIYIGVREYDDTNESELVFESIRVDDKSMVELLKESFALKYK